MPFHTKLARWLLPLALFVLTVIWGYSWVIAKQALVYASPFVFAAERCVGGAVALLLTVRLMGKPLVWVAPGPTLAMAS